MRRTILLFTAIMLALVVASGVALAATITGPSGPDVRSGTNAFGEMNGLGGNDTLGGLGGNDDIDGGSGHDKLYGGSGIDLIYGGRGDDLVVSDGGGGELYGGPGRDTIRGTVGLEDEVYGNSGNDMINTTQDGVFDYVDCGLYADYVGTAPDYDTADVDVGLDFTVDCENRFYSGSHNG